MRKSLKITLILACIILLSGLVIQTLYSLDKNSKNELALVEKDAIIKDLENTIKQLEEKNEIISMEFKDIKFARDEQEKIENKFEWIDSYNWNKLTLTNTNGTTIDITESGIIKHHLYQYLKKSFEFNYYIPTPISKAYTYTFYFDDYSKEITLSNNAFVHGEWARNTFLYDVAEALLPEQDELNDYAYNARQLLLLSKFFSSEKMYNTDNLPIPYAKMRFIILEWMKENTIKIDKLPNNVNNAIINIESSYHGKKAYFKTYTYENIDDVFTEDYYIELSTERNREFYKLVDNPSGSLWNIFSAEIQ